MLLCVPLSPSPAVALLALGRGLLVGVAIPSLAQTSRMIVTGPSLTSSTCIRAPKTPVSTGTPLASASQNAS